MPTETVLRRVTVMKSAATLVMWALLHEAYAGDATATQVVVRLPLEKITVTRDSTNAAVFSDANVQGPAGYPALPMLTFTVLLPPNADMSSVRADIRGRKTEELAGEWDVKPAPPVSKMDGEVWPAGAVIVEGRDINAYARDSLWPPSLLGSVKTSQMREWRMATIALSPYQYNPVRKKLIRLVEGELAFTFDRLPQSQIMHSRSPDAAARFRGAVAGAVVNFDEFAAEYETSANQ